MLSLLIILSCLLLTTYQTDANSVKRNGAEDDLENWTGSWFPFPPGAKVKNQPLERTKNLCDDGEYEIQKDFDPKDKRHSYNYLCIDNRSHYTPDLSREPVLNEYFMPPAYVPTVKCLNETIIYKDALPTFGSFRPLPPKYGSYRYLPPQRYLRSLADGAIVMLYHPCAYAEQVRLLENILKGCLYRHIITPSNALTKERPLALLSWGNALQMSVVDDRIVVEFIKQNAKHGVSFKHSELLHVKMYEAGILLESHLVTNADDTEICAYKDM